MYSMKRTSRAALARELDERHELVVVHAADDHRIELQSGKERGGDIDAGDHPIERVVAGELAEARPVQRVETDGQPMQPGRRASAVACCSSSTPFVVIAEIADRWSRRQPRDQIRKAAPEERLATGQTNLGDAEADEDIDEGFDLLEVQDVFPRQPHVVLFRHAVAAAQVAPVGDGEPEIAQRAVVPVVDHALSFVTWSPRRSWPGALPSAWQA